MHPTLLILVGIFTTLKCIWSELFLLDYWKELSNDEEWSCDSTLACIVTQDFDLCKLDDLWWHNVDTKWCKITNKIVSLSRLQALSIQRVTQSFPPSGGVICTCCSFSGCERICSTSKRKSAKHQSNKWGIFQLRKVEVWSRVCCYGDVIFTITMWSSHSTSTLQNFNPVDFVFAQIFYNYFVTLHHFVATLWRHKSSYLHKSMNLKFSNQECYHSKINVTLIILKALSNKLIKKLLYMHFRLQTNLYYRIVKWRRCTYSIPL